MSKTQLFQLAGLAGVVSGILLIVLDFAFIAIFGDQPERIAAASTSWLILLILSIVAAFLVLMALMGLFARQAEEFGRFGLAAFVIASFGTVMNIGYNWGGSFIVPELASAAPDFLDQVADSPPAIIAAGFISTFTLFALGWLLFAIASLKTKTLPALPLWLMIIASILGLVSRIAGLGFPGVLFGVALAWLGWHMWRGVGNRQAVSKERWFMTEKT
jgi:tetrahydromethanopterin S-methyltransferase subunit E